jgi:hypothetical protein
LAQGGGQGGVGALRLRENGSHTRVTCHQSSLPAYNQMMMPPSIMWPRSY